MVEFIYQRPMELQITADEVLRGVGKRPHLTLRIAIRGGLFPLRALELFARIGSTDRPVRALLAEVDDDERGMRAYFATDVPMRGTLTVGYGSEVTATIPLDKVKLKPTRLDEAKIKGAFHRVTLDDLGAFKRHR
ncbi:MAG: hypothetical protein ABI857_06195 [Acidobacteriota bacterium]